MLPSYISESMCYKVSPTLLKKKKSVTSRMTWLQMFLTIMVIKVWRKKTLILGIQHALTHVWALQLVTFQWQGQCEKVHPVLYNSTCFWYSESTQEHTSTPAITMLNDALFWLKDPLAAKGIQTGISKCIFKYCYLQSILGKKYTPNIFFCLANINIQCL